MPKSPEYLRLVNGIYQVQYAVPKPLQQIVATLTGHKNRPGKDGNLPPVPFQPWFIISTGTGNLKEARRERDEKILPYILGILKQAEAIGKPETLAADIIGMAMDDAAEHLDMDASPMHHPVAGSFRASRYAAHPRQRSDQHVELVSMAALIARSMVAHVPEARRDAVLTMVSEHFDAHEGHAVNLAALSEKMRKLLPTPMPAATWEETQNRIEGATIAGQPSGKSYTFTECIDELWIPKRRRAGKSVSDQTVNKLTRSKVERLVRFLGHDDMEQVSRDRLEEYYDKHFPGSALGTVRDHIIIVKALFDVAHKREKISHNPAKEITYSKENTNPGRAFWRSERDAIIGAAWGCSDDTIKWLWLLACCYGPRIAEFAEASVRDVVVEDGVPVIYLDTLHRKGEEKTLKTADSRRWLPIHSAMREAFMARIDRLRREHGDNAPLFPDLKVYDGRRNKDASNRVNDWLKRQVKAKALTIADAENKSYHSLRHTVSTALKGCKWSDFITGHAATSIKGKVYEHPPLDEVVKDVETLKMRL